MIIADVEGELDFKGPKIKTLAVTNFCVKSYEMTGYLKIQIVLFCCINLVILFFLTACLKVFWVLHGKYIGGSYPLQSTQSYKG